jgi:hypothetical protein
VLILWPVVTGYTVFVFPLVLRSNRCLFDLSFSLSPTFFVCLWWHVILFYFKVKHVC